MFPCSFQGDSFRFQLLIFEGGVRSLRNSEVRKLLTPPEVKKHSLWKIDDSQISESPNFLLGAIFMWTVLENVQRALPFLMLNLENKLFSETANLHPLRLPLAHSYRCLQEKMLVKILPSPLHGISHSFQSLPSMEKARWQDRSQTRWFVGFFSWV